MKRILFVSPTGGYAGIDVCMETLVLGLDREKIEPIVVFPQKALLKSIFEDQGIRCYELPLNWWFPIGFSSNDILHVLPTLRDKVDPLVQIIKDNQINVVMSNTSVALDGAVAAGICGVPHIFFLHAQYASNIYVDMLQETREFLYSLMGRLSSKVVCCSRLLHDVISQYVDNSMYIYNGVDIDRFTFCPKSLEKEGPRLRLVCVGHFNANKQQDFVLRALNTLQEERPDLLPKVSFTMVGPGEDQYKALLRKLISEYRLEKCVSMEDFRDDIHQYLKKFNCYINCSITENLPVSVLEAMSCGLPTLGTINDGTLQTIQEGENGFLCAEPEEMAHRIIQLLETPGLLEDMSVKARKSVEAQFTTKLFISQFQKLFLDVAKADGPAKKDAKFINGFYESVVGRALHKFPFRKVLVIYPPAAMPTYMLGVKYPFDLLKEKGVLEYLSITPEQFDKKILDEYDTVLCVRFYDDTAYDILKNTKKCGRQFVWLIDDNYSGLHVENGTVVHEEKVNPMYERMYIESSHVVVFSGDMYHFGNRLTQNITRAPTIQPDNRKYLDVSARENGNVVLGFMGTLMRDNDFACVVPAIQRVIEKYGSDVRVEFVGYCPEELADNPCVERFDFIPDYDEFRKFFASRKWDIGLAPLNDTLFNRCKTNNKYREYSSYRIAGIFSNISAYNCVEHGINGYLTENTEDAWFEAMCALIEDKNLRQSIAQCAHEDVLENYSVENYAKVLMRVFCQQMSNTSTFIIDPETYGPHVPRFYRPEHLALSKRSRSCRYWLSCNKSSISAIGLLFGSEKQSRGTVTVRIYDGRKLLCESRRDISELSLATWNYFSFEKVDVTSRKTLWVEVAVDDREKAFGVFLDNTKRTFLFKVFSKLGFTLPKRDVLMVDFV